MTGLPQAGLLLQATGVWLALAALYVLLPWLSLRRRFPELNRVEILLASGLCGLAFQTLLGSLISWMLASDGRGFLLLNLCLYAGGCLAAWILSRPRSLPPRPPLPSGEALRLLLLLTAGTVARWIHPLSNPALGQSDAYSHLWMLRNLLETGSWVAGYPPAFGRVMALPGLLFRIDPYVLARFGGAFWGTALILAVWCLGRRISERPRAGWIAAALVACFPGLDLLRKTGVGLFPNQAGLLWIPVVLGAVLVPRHRVPLLALAASSLILLVPMMALHVVVILLLFSLPELSKLRMSRKVWRLTLGGLILLGGVGVLLLMRLPSPLDSVRIAVFTSGDEAGAVAVAPEALTAWQGLLRLGADWLRIKRMGLGSPLLNSVGLALLCGFAVCLVMGWRNDRPGLRLLGLWGGITALQTLSGFAQFTAYQREGWSLLLALALLGGVVGAWVLASWKALRPLEIPGLLLLAGLGLWLYPRHQLSNSPSEPALIRVARMLRSDLPLLNLPLLRVPGELLVVTRPFLQEMMLPAVAGTGRGLRFSGSDIWRSYREDIPASPCTLVLLDAAGNSSALPPAFAAVSPESAARFAEQQQRSQAFNQDLEAFVLGLDPADFQISAGYFEGELRYYLIQKLPSTP